MKGIFINHETLRGATARKIRTIAGHLDCNEIHLGRKINGKAKLKLEELNAIAGWLGRDATDFIAFADIDDLGQKIGENAGV
jgi:hypothetical protein